MLSFDRGHRTLRAHFSLGIAKFDTLSNLLLTLDKGIGNKSQSRDKILYILLAVVFYPVIMIAS